MKEASDMQTKQIINHAARDASFASAPGQQTGDCKTQNENTYHPHNRNRNRMVRALDPARRTSLDKTTSVKR